MLVINRLLLFKSVNRVYAEKEPSFLVQPSSNKCDVKPTWVSFFCIDLGFGSVLLKVSGLILSGAGELI